MSFSGSVSSPGQRQNYRTLAQAIKHQIFQWTVILLNQSTALYTGYIESAEQSRTAEQNKISKLTVKLQIISTEHDCRM